MLSATKNVCCRSGTTCIVSNRLEPVDFAIRTVNSVLNLPVRQVKVFSGIQITEVL